MFSKEINTYFPQKAYKTQEQSTKLCYSYSNNNTHTSNVWRCAIPRQPSYLFICGRMKAIVQRSARATNLSRPTVNALMNLVAFSDLDLTLC